MQIIFTNFYLCKTRSIEVSPCVNLSLCVFLACTCDCVINCRLVTQVRAGRSTWVGCAVGSSAQVGLGTTLHVVGGLKVWCGMALQLCVKVRWRVCRVFSITR